MTSRSLLTTSCAGLGWAFSILLFAGCNELLTLPEDVHVFGQYQTCLQRLSDTCVDPDGTCRTKSTDNHVFLIGVRRGTSEFLIAREGLEPVSGVLEGTRFRIETTVELPDICGCPAQVTEVIEGELLTTSIGAITCEPIDGSCSVQPPDLDDGAGDHTETGDVELDFERRYPAIRGTVTNEVRVLGEQSCDCLPCRTEFHFKGRP